MAEYIEKPDMQYVLHIKSNKKVEKRLIDYCLESVVDVFEDTGLTADVQPMKRGRWEEVPDWYDNDVHYRCSACNAEFYLEVGTPLYNEYWYCPHCGADMREPEPIKG